MPWPLRPSAAAGVKQRGEAVRTGRWEPSRGAAVAEQPGRGAQSPRDGGTSCGGAAAAAAHLAPLCCSEGKGWHRWWGSAIKTPGAMGLPVTGTRCLRSLREGEMLGGLC